MTPQPDLAEQAAIISTMRFVKTMMGLFTRSDIGPPPDIQIGRAHV